MTLYEIVLFLHVMGAIGLFMGVAIVLTAMARMRRSESVAQVREWSGLADLSDKLLPVASLVLLLSGIYMATDFEFWGDGWVDVSMALLLVMIVLGPAVNARRLGTISREAKDAPDGPVQGALRARILDPVLWTTVQTMSVVAVGIVFLMTVKPGIAGSLVTLVVALALGLASSIPAWRRAAAVRAPAGG
ncbi:MAG TPA: DUF2269 family protein [Dehalococcoidia bacterium]